MIMAAGWGIADGYGVELQFPDRWSAGERQDKVSMTMFGKHTAYSSEELIFLRSVLDEAVGRLPGCMRTSSSRSTIARRIMDCAATGERDRVELRLAGLVDFREAGKSAA
jgi:hypothetical protein